MMTAQVKPWTRIPDYNSARDMSTGLLSFDADTCKRCNICTFICPARSIVRDSTPGGWNNGLPHLRYIAPDITGCVACGCCVAACPTGAIGIARSFMPGDYYQRLTQTRDMVWPKLYLADEGAEPARTGGASGTADDPMPRVSTLRAIKQRYNALMWIVRGARGAASFFVNEFRQKRGWKTLGKFVRSQTFDISWAQLLEESAEAVPDKACLLYNDESLTYRDMNGNANRLGNYLLDQGGGRGDGLGILMRNSPRFLDLFFGSQKIGMYTVPINPELKGEGLAYIINHSDITRLAVDAELLTPVLENLDRFDRLRPENIIVNDIEAESSGIAIPDGMQRLSEAYGQPPADPGIGYNPEDLCLIIYTSGTTGPPKGVVYRYNTSGVLLLSLGGRIFFRSSDIYYTYLSLCHGNALFLTTTMTLAVRGTVALSRKFSASRFWDTVRKHRATVFNTIGSIIPILMKQPEKPDDRDHAVRVVLSAACPADMWIPFEQRFGLTLYEGYGAVDGGGKGIMNLGTAPPGSLGKPSAAVTCRIVDETGREVTGHAPGELLFAVGKGQSAVEYYKNPAASEKKSKDGWLHTGDIVRRDAQGYLYFVGRNTESMRKGGENVSAYEVEHVMLQHPAIEDVAVYAVPSELGEDEIMASIKPVNGNRPDPEEIRAFLSDKLARYAIPRYLRFVDEFPKTNTHRIIKRRLEEQGVTDDTYDALARS
jgi:crotonobetaine/carnitine-CoA ligase